MTLLAERVAARKEELSEGKPDPGRKMSELEFVQWADSKTLAEWVDGQVIMMSPVSSRHDNVQGWLRILMQLFVEQRELGEVKGPEFMVRLGRQRRRRMPDLLFVAASRQHIVMSEHVEGAPDLIVEVVSPESVARDWREKYYEYERAGVREYWIIDPSTERMEAYVLGKGGKYQQLPEADGKLGSRVLDGFYLRARWIFAARLPRVTTTLREMGVRL